MLDRENEKYYYEMKKLSGDLVHYLNMNENPNEEIYQGEYNLAYLQEHMSEEDFQKITLSFMKNISLGTLREYISNEFEDLAEMIFSDYLQNSHIEIRLKDEEIEVNPSITREALIQKAKDEIKSLISNSDNFRGRDDLSVDFTVEFDTVIASLKDNDGTVLKFRKTKCSEDTCFNESIGKVIALNRLFNKKVDKDYLNSSFPTDIQVNDTVTYKGDLEELFGVWTVVHNHHLTNKARKYIKLDDAILHNFVVINDSHRV
jgi:hypothetical protein